MRRGLDRLRIDVVVGCLGVHIDVHDFRVHIHVDVHGNILRSVVLGRMLVVMRHLAIEMPCRIVPGMLEMVWMGVDLIIVVGLLRRLMAFDYIVEVYQVFVLFGLCA